MSSRVRNKVRIRYQVLEGATKKTKEHQDDRSTEKASRRKRTELRARARARNKHPASWLRLYLEAWSHLLVWVGTGFGFAVFLETGTFSAAETDVFFAAETDISFALAEAGTGASVHQG